MQIRQLADGCQTKRKVLRESITHHCLYHVFTARKVISNFCCVVLSHKIHNFKPKGQKDKRTFAERERLRQNPAVNRNKVTTRHCGPLEARVASQSGGQKIENSSQTNDFDFENLSSLQSFVGQDRMTFGV